MVLFRQYGIRMNLKKIYRLMKEYHLSCPIRKVNPHKKAGKTKNNHYAPNILERKFNQGNSGHVLLTDNIYITELENVPTYRL